MPAKQHCVDNGKVYTQFKLYLGYAIAASEFLDHLSQYINVQLIDQYWKFKKKELK